jgi:hypothetical protein
MMKVYMKIIPLLTVLLFACDNYDISSDQSESFIKYYALNQVNAGAGVCETSDGGYAFLGNTKTEFLGTEICLILTDMYGNSTQLPKYIGHEKNDIGYCIKPASDGGLIILGSTQKTTGNEDLDVFLIRTNHLGDTLWTKVFNGDDKDPKDDEGYWFDVKDNGDIMMVGYATMTDYSDSEKKQSRQIWIYVVDQYGDEIIPFKPKFYGLSTNADEARFIQRINDGYIIAGVSNFSNTTTPTRHSFILQLKPDYTFGPFLESASDANEEATCLTILNDTAFVVSGNTWNTSTDGADVLLYKVNMIYYENDKFYFERKWTKPFKKTGDDKGTFVLAEDNEIHVLATQSNGDKSSLISIITTTSNGANEQSVPFGGASLMQSQAFGFSSDGGFIISGTNKLSDDYSSMVLIKTKSGGKF